MALQSNRNRTAGIQTDLIDSMNYQVTSLPDDEMKWAPSPGRTGYAQLTTIEKLIPEIALIVSEFLRDADVAALSLTSKTMFLKYLPRARLTPPERKQLLLRLEKELPQMYYCHGCVKLHPWHLSWYDMYKDEETCIANMPTWRTRRSHKYAGTLFHCPRTAPFVIPGRYVIPYHLARPIMNRHRYGPGHGPPEDVLDRSVKSAMKVITNDALVDRFINWSIVESNLHTARIRDGQLIVYSVVSVYDETQSPQNLFYYLRTVGVNVCMHLATQRTSREENMCKLHEPRSAKAFSLDLYITRSCYKCMTDYTIQVENKDARGWVVTIRTWQNLGSVLSPSTWDWKHMTLTQAAMDMGTVEPRCREAKRDERYGPGMVRSTYYSVNGMRETPEASFHLQSGLESLELYLLFQGHGPSSQVQPGIKPSLSVEDDDVDVDM